MARKEHEEKRIARPLSYDSLDPSFVKCSIDDPTIDRNDSESGRCMKGLERYGSGPVLRRQSTHSTVQSKKSSDGFRAGTPYPVVQTEQKQVFLDAAAMKAKVRANLMKKIYAVTDYYKDYGIFQAIVRNSKFESLTLLIIAMNAIWIAVDTDYNDAEVLLDAHAVFQLAENLFCAYFAFEWIARYSSFRSKQNCLKDAWFVFDSLLVLTMVLETWVMTLVMVMSGGGGGGGMGNASILRIARLLRLSRMARMARLLRAMPELMVLIKGMLAATRSVFFTLCLLILIMYIFAIAFTQLTANTSVGNRHFKSVSASMYTLLVHGALLDDVSGISNRLGKDSFVFAAVFFVFSLLAALTVMNMLIGVLCEVVSAVAATEKEEMMLNYVHEKLKNVLSLLDTDGDQMISKKEFVEVVMNFDAARALQEVGVDVVGLIDFADFIFVDYDDDGNETESDLSFERFMEVILQLRGTNNATVKDIVDLRKFLHKGMQSSNEKLLTIQKQLSVLTASAGVSSNDVGANHSFSMLHSTSTKTSYKDPNLAEPAKCFRPTQVVDQSKELFDVQMALNNLSVDSLINQSSKAPVVSPQKTPMRFDIEAVEGNARELPIHIVSTPSATLFQTDGFSLEVEAAARDIGRESQWDSLPGNNFLHDDLAAVLEASSRYSPIRSEDGRTNLHSTNCLERDSATTIHNAGVDVSDEVNSLRGQVARLGSVLQSGISEYQKLQDWVVQEHARDVAAQGLNFQPNGFATIAKSAHPKQGAASEKALPHRLNSIL